MSGGLRAEAVEVDRAGRPVLRGVSLSVPRGCVTALLAPSGRGKSTLLRAFVRLEPLAAGRVLLDEQDALDLDPRELRRRVGLVPQAPAMLPGTAAENVLYGLATSASGDVVGAALAAAGAPDGLRHRVAGELSGGEQGRVAVARALARSPEVLLLDEPTAALDRRLADHLGATLRALAVDGLAVLVATHDEAWAQRHADERTTLGGP